MAKSAREPGTAGGDWTPEEVAVVVSSYFRLFDQSTAGREVNKAAEYKRLHALLPERTASAIEYKFQNISGVLFDMGLPWMPGLAPAVNYQDLLVLVVEDFVANREGAIAAIAEQASDQEEPSKRLELVAAPAPLETTDARQRAMTSSVARKIDYAERESRNRRLGQQGERLVFEWEKQRLIDAGREDLARRVQHVSADQGDGLGFDVLSFHWRSSAELLIEVKTTRSGIATPFYLTSNELRTSEMRSDAYSLFRIHEFGARNRVYVLNGNLRTVCSLNPAVFRAMPLSA